MDALLSLDHQIFLALNFPGGELLDKFFFLVSGKLTWIPLYLLIVYLLVTRYGWKKALLALAFMGLTVVLVDQIANIFKTYTPRLRPTHTDELKEFVHTVKDYRGGRYGTVSAHAASVFSIAISSLALIRSKIYSICILVWALLVSYSRIYLGVHFPLDIFYGMVLGIISGMVSIKLYYRTINALRL